MKYIKSVSLSLFFACLCLFATVNNAFTEYCNASDSPSPAGTYCWANGTHPCEGGCYCSGGPYIEYGGLLDKCNPSNGTFKFGAISHSSPVAGVHVCPSTHPNSFSDAGSVNNCFKYCDPTTGYNVKYAYFQSGCGAGQYLPAVHENCVDCPPGKYCDESSPIISSCTSDQGISGSCDTENKYSVGGKKECTECTEAGKAVTKDGTLNVNCEVCGAGTYANDGHTACEICEAGYKCTNGIKTQCTGNEYSLAQASECTECTGDGKAVVKDNGLNIDCKVCDAGTYANADHSQCIDCPAGYACSNGFKNDDLCPPGKCAAYQGSGGGFHCVNSRGAECKTCNEIDSTKPYSIPARTQCVKCDNPVDYYENGECQNCPSVPYNVNLYQRVRIDGQSGMAMCGIKLIAGNCDISENDVSVKWHIVNDAWKLVEEFSVKANMWHYVKDPSPTSPDGSDADADWCGECPTGKFNIYANRTGESACVACPVGYCTSNNSCDPCTAGYYCPGTNGEADSCVIGVSKFACPKGSFSAPGQVSCTKCASGYTTQTKGTSYNPDDDLNQICQKIKIRLMFNNNQWKNLPDIFKNVKMNASVLQPQQ